MEKIYTHDIAMQIVGMFEDVLDEYNIHIPSPEDYEREEDNMVGLYGSTYSDLMDEVEDFIIALLHDSGATAETVEYEFSGTV